MKVFISSRMDELWFERKVAVETVHFKRHTPIYIETQQQKLRPLELRTIMNRMVKEADAMVFLYGISDGEAYKVYHGMTPIQYEFCQFLDIDKRTRSTRPMLVLCHRPMFPDTKGKTALPGPGKAFLRYVRDRYPGWVKSTIDKYGRDDIEIKDFDTPDNVRESLLAWARTLPEPPDRKLSAHRYVVSYRGADFPGLIQALSEILFAQYKLNIDYISHASRSGEASTYISCSTVDGGPVGAKMLRVGVREAFRTQRRAQLLGLQRSGRFSLAERLRIEERAWSINAKRVEDDNALYHVYLEARMIDAPGQLNALCKPIVEMGYTIDEIVLKPTDIEHEFQTTATLWLKRLSEPADDTTCLQDLRELEGRLRKLTGLQAFTTKLVIHKPGTCIKRLAKERIHPRCVRANYPTPNAQTAECRPVCGSRNPRMRRRAHTPTRRQ